VIPAVELSSEIEGIDTHILGYYIDTQNPVLRKRLDEMKEARFVRAKKIVQNLNKQGLDLRFETVPNIEGKGPTGRPPLSGYGGGAWGGGRPGRGAEGGLDRGEKTSGVALSDLRQMVATPIETLKREKFTADAAKLLALLGARHAGGIILGLPLNMDGSEGPRVQSTRAFARNLERLTPLPIGFWDERLSTVAATRAMLEADLSRKQRAQRVDNVAASFILQGVLDRLQHLSREG